MTRCEGTTDFRPGYPLDRRRRAQKRKRNPIEGDIESRAGRVIARFSNECVVLQDDGSRPGMADIAIEYRDRPTAFVEVTTDLERGYAAMYGWLKEKGRKPGGGWHIPPTVPMPRLHREWSVTISGRSYTEGRTLDNELEGLLAELEVAGVVFDYVARLNTSDLQPNRAIGRLRHLGVVMLSSISAAAGAARLYPEGIVGPTEPSWEAFLEWLGNTLASEQLADVRKKLAATQAPERHLFFVPTPTSPGDVFFALTIDQLGLPSAAPQLPIEITHLWVMNAVAADRCLAWFPERGWLDTRDHWATA